MMWKSDFPHTKVASDLDGTLLDYNYVSGEPKINTRLLDHWLLAGVRHIAFVSNQGGLPFGVLGRRRADGRAYPTPELAALRLEHAVHACQMAGILVVGVVYCVWRPRAETPWIETAARRLREALKASRGSYFWCVYATERARKPSGLMLRALPGLVGWQPYAFYGDSDEDEAAAKDAGVQFERVERFCGG